MHEDIKKQLETFNQQVKDLTAIYRCAASQHSVSENEFWVWYTLLVSGEEYSQQDICEMWSLPKQTINSVIAHLRQKGFLSLEMEPGTRNRKIIRLTESGKAFGEKIVTPIYEAEQRTLARLTVQEREQCVALMEKYVTTFREELDEK
ncbi:MarR family transcriptional regulator [Oscillospiraceae bacterium]|nr:MarR family transcriptional regulator [Oscillospiraceae bacterium]